MIKAIVPALLVGLIVGAFGGYQMRRPAGEQSESSVAPSTRPSITEKDPYYSNNLTLTEMYENLSEATGDEFDHRLLMYEIAIKQNESGFLRAALEKSNQVVMKDYADTQLLQNDASVRMMYGWQKQWGYNHH